MTIANYITLIGNLGKKPRAIETSTDNPMVVFNIAVDKPYNGEEQSPDWFKVVAFGQLAIRCYELLNKGSKVLVDGKLSNHAWMDEEGREQTATEVVANEIYFLTPLWRKKEAVNDEQVNDSPPTDVVDLPV
jgi:single-strand DNA-binding protein